jgi:hypothetical protein
MHLAGDVPLVAPAHWASGAWRQRRRETVNADDHPAASQYGALVSEQGVLGALRRCDQEYVHHLERLREAIGRAEAVAATDAIRELHTLNAQFRHLVEMLPRADGA